MENISIDLRRTDWNWVRIAEKRLGLVLHADGFGSCLLYPFAIKDDKDHPVSHPTLIVAAGLVLGGHILELFAVLRQKSILYWLEDLFLYVDYHAAGRIFL